MIGKPYRSYVAIGDSLSEGLGDFTFHQDRHHNGWTDRLAGILAKEAQASGFDFQYANLAIRGANLNRIMQRQLPLALRLQPDLVTVMAGSNDLMAKPDSLPLLKSALYQGILELKAAGCDVVVANTINPLHLRIFKPLRSRSERLSAMIQEVASDLDSPVLDVFGIQDFEQLMFWAEDMVHFSGFGHITVANRAASLLNLNYRYPELDPQELTPISRSLVETAHWVVRDVVPFVKRKLRGVTAGDGLSPKQTELQSFQPKTHHPNWELIGV